MPRVLVTGIESMLGANLILRFAQSCEVLGLHERRAAISSAVKTCAWQPDSPAGVEQTVREFGPDWLVHAGPLAVGSWDTPPSAQEAEREIQRVTALGKAATAQGCRLALLSSDVVFAGPRLFHDESSATSAASAWAQQVLRMERAAGESGALVVRTHAYGWGGTENDCFAARAAQMLLAGSSLKADGRRHATPILAADLADLLLACFDQRLAGIFHLSGAERTSPFHFVQELAIALGVDLPQQPAVSSADSTNDETSLSSKRARRALACSTPMLRAGLERFVAQRRNGWRDSLLAGQRSVRHEVAA